MSDRDPTTGVFKVEARPDSHQPWQRLAALDAEHNVREFSIVVPRALIGPELDLRISRLGGGRAHLDGLFLDGIQRQRRR
jgi:hypothetical protein